MLTQTRCWRSLDRKLISVDTLKSGDAKRRSLTRKIAAADGDNTWQIGQIKVASYFQNKPKNKLLSTQRIFENYKTRKTGAKD